IGSQKLGQPVPLSNLVRDSNNGSAQPAQTNVPLRFSSFNGLVNARSVPSSRNTLNCAGVSKTRHSAGVLTTLPMKAEGASAANIRPQNPATNPAIERFR